METLENKNDEDIKGNESDEAILNILRNVSKELEEKVKLDRIKSSFRPGVDLPLNSKELEIKLIGMMKKGNVKLSNLFLVLFSKEEGDRNFTLPEQMIKNMKEGVSALVNCKAIRIFFGHYPGNYILDHNKFDYPSAHGINSNLNKIAERKSKLPLVS